LGIKISVIFLSSVSLISYKYYQEFSVQNGYIDVDTDYSRVIIYKSYERGTGRPVRVMSIDAQSSSAMFLDGDDLVYDYTEYYNLGKYFKPDLKNALMIGGAAYSYPKEFLKRFPNAQIDVVEIDPKLTSLARTYFNLQDSPNLKVLHEDGRVYMNKNLKKYDAIYADVFSSLYEVPHHLTTVEFAKMVQDSLTDGGVYIANIISSLEGNKANFFKSEYRTLKEVFPIVYVYRVREVDPFETQNIIIVAFKGIMDIPEESDDVEINQHLSTRYIYEGDSDGIILTDNYAPIERFALEMLSK
jgi:spermidine synthase